MKENVFISQPRKAAKQRIVELRSALDYIEKLIDEKKDDEDVAGGHISHMLNLSNEIALFLVTSNGASEQYRNNI